MINIWLAWIFCTMTFIGGYLFAKEKYKSTSSNGQDADLLNQKRESDSHR